MRILLINTAIYGGLPDEPDTYLLATNRSESIRYFVELAFNVVDIAVEWKGENETEQGFCSKTGKLLVQVNPKFFRPAEVGSLIGDYSKAKEKLSWEI